MRVFSRHLPDGTPTAVTLGSHPLHPMVVTFPIAFLMAAPVSDLAFLLTADPFWARLSLWLAGGGAAMGALAGLVGMAELLAIPTIRQRAAAWSHFVAAVTLLSVAFFNWFIRSSDPVEAVYPLGLGLSLLGASLVAVAGWIGGKLVFEHRVGVHGGR